MQFLIKSRNTKHIEETLSFSAGPGRKLPLAKEFYFGRKGSHFPYGTNSKTPSLIIRSIASNKCILATNPAYITAFPLSHWNFQFYGYSTCLPQFSLGRRRGKHEIKKAATWCDRHIYKFSHFYNPLVSNSIDISSFSVKIKLSDRRR